MAKKRNRKGRNLSMEQEAQRLARVIDQGLPRGVGFTLFLYEFGEQAWMTYVSNGRRDDMINAVQEWLDLQRRTPGGIGTPSN